MKNFRLKVTLKDGRKMNIDRERLCECEGISQRFEQDGLKVEFFHLRDGQETRRVRYETRPA